MPTKDNGETKPSKCRWGCYEQRASPRKMNMREIEPDRWIPFLAEFTRENRGAHARLEVLAADQGYQVETENPPFDGVSRAHRRAEISARPHVLSPISFSQFRKFRLQMSA
jgi:hypothetical protein